MAIDTCSLNIKQNMQETDTRGTPVFACSAYITKVGQKINEIIPVHWHDELEVLFVRSGSLLVDILGETYSLHEGEGMFINSGVLMSAKSKNEHTCEVHSMVFCSTLLADTNTAIEQRYVRPLISCTQFPCSLTSKEQSEYINRAFLACSEERFGYEIEVREHLIRLIFEIICQNADIIKSDTLPCTDRERLKNMLAFIENNFAQNITVHDIADVCKVSERECFRCFKGMMGVSPKKHLMSYRISVASGMLLGTDDPIVEISGACGFDSPGYFSAIFKRLMGVTPKEYRNAERQKQAGVHK